MGLTVEQKRLRRNVYMRRYYQAYRAKHGVSSTTKWRRENPAAAQKHRETEKARWHREPVVRERHKAKGKHYRQELKRQALMAYGGIVCVCCGETEERFLTLDHLDNDGARHRKQIRAQGFAGVAFYSYLRARKYPMTPPLQVHCYNCNCGKQANGGVCPHITG